MTPVARLSFLAPVSVWPGFFNPKPENGTVEKRVVYSITTQCEQRGPRKAFPSRWIYVGCTIRAIFSFSFVGSTLIH